MLTEYQIRILKETNSGKMVKVDKEDLLQATILATNNFLSRVMGDKFIITPQGVHLCRVFELNEAHGHTDSEKPVVLFKGEKCTYTL